LCNNNHINNYPNLFINFIGLLIDGKHFHFRLLYFIADSPAKAVILNTNRFNGYFGCIHCLHPGVQHGPGKRLYLVLPDILMRNNSMYKNSVQEAIETNTVVQGVRDFNFNIQ
jgi:hypothetical protein